MDPVAVVKEKKKGKEKPDKKDDKKQKKENVLAEFMKIRGMTKERAETLYGVGITSKDLLKKAIVDDLTKLKGFDEKSAVQILSEVKGKSEEEVLAESKKHRAEPEEEKEEKTDSPKKDEKDKRDKKGDKKRGKKTEEKSEEGGGGVSALEKWLMGDEEESIADWLKGDEAVEKEKKRKLPGPSAKTSEKTKDAGKEEIKTYTNNGSEDEGVESLRRWLMGDEDTSLEEWLMEEPEEEKVEEQEGGVPLLIQSADLESLKKEIEKLIGDIKEGKVKVADIVAENATLKATLAEEIRKREQMERDLENVKKSSVAVIKYIKAQQAKMAGKDAMKLQKMLEQQMKLKENLEMKLHETEKELKRLREELEKKIEELPPDVQELKKKEMELLEKERELSIKEKTLLQKEEALASGEELLLKEAGESFNGSGAAGGISPDVLAEKEEEWLRERERLLAEKAEVEKKLQEVLVEKKHLEEKLKHMGMDESAISKELALKEKELANKEKELALKEAEFEELKRSLALKEEEIRKLRETIAFKEEELLRREEDIMHREKLLEAERRKIEEAKRGLGSLELQEAQKRLEELKAKIAEKEREIKAKEKYLRAKEEELRLREQGIIEEEIEAREEDRLMEWKIEKVKTGVPRLDDLLMGGIPFGSNVALYGPPFVGKETLMNLFIAEGLKKGVPAIWVITDKTPSEIREEMSFVLSGYEEYEKMDLVRYVDTYSIGVGEEPNDPYTAYIEDISDYKKILEAVDKFAAEFKKKHKYYRLVFRSVSTVVAYLGATTTFKFLQPFTGRRKRDKAVALYAIEKGMHSETEIQSISHVMDGTIDFKVEQMKTYLAVQGICEVQSRAYIQYTHSKQSINIGSFTLDHIR